MSHIAANTTSQPGSARVSAPLIGTLTLRVTAGPDTGTSLVINDACASRLLIGRGPTCDLNLKDTATSRRHLAVELVNGRARLSDLDSTNGSQVDGLAIGAVWLRGGETIRIGQTVIATEHRDHSSPPRLAEASRFGRFLGQSREIRRLYPLFERLASGHAPVLIEGDTGTGKEVLAEALHEQGPRASAAFVVLDAASIGPGELEATLFGIEGATGDAPSRTGLFEEAAGGTLFIDEVAELSPAVQAKLLRAVERGEFRRVGGQSIVRVNARIIAATRRDLDREVQERRFRDDLFHRLSVARVELPRLSRRLGDIPLLAAAFCAQLGKPMVIAPDVLSTWEQIPWPGNIRELRNAVTRYVELGALRSLAGSEGDAGAVSAAAPEVVDAVDRVLALNLPMAAARQQLIDEFERRYVERVLAAHGGNVTRAAEASGIARRHFHRLLARHRKASP